MSSRLARTASRFLRTIALTALSIGPANAQELVVTPIDDPVELVRQLLGAAYDNGIQVDPGSVTLTGQSAQQGRFVTRNGCRIFDFSRGIVVSSGRAADLEGPNDDPYTTTSWGTAGDADLDDILGFPGITGDANRLSFEFTVDPGVEVFELRYVFASEEYLEYVNSEFNDVLAICVDPEAGDCRNFALVGSPPQAVSVNSVHPEENPQFFVNNEAGIFNTEANGFTRRLDTIDVLAALGPGEVHEIVIVIGDASDLDLDSWGLVSSRVKLDGEFVTDVTADPPTGTIDARQPHPPSSNALADRQGLGSPNSYPGGPEPIAVTLGPELTGVDASCWEICETCVEDVEGAPPLEPNEILSVTERAGEPGTYDVLLERPISAGCWSSLTYLGDGSQVSFASLPGDVNGDRVVTTMDLTDLIEHFDAGSPLPHGTYSCDADHSGSCLPADVQRVGELMKGLETFVTWYGRRLPQNSCACPPLCKPLYAASFEADDGGWTLSPTSTCTAGDWGVGAVTNGEVATQPHGDHTTGWGDALLTQPNVTTPGTEDVDAGVCIARSATYPVAEASVVSIWYYCGQQDAGDDADFCQLEVSQDGGATWSTLVTVPDGTRDAVWLEATTTVPAGSSVALRYLVADDPATGDLVEGGVDDLSICSLADPQSCAVIEDFESGSGGWVNDSATCTTGDFVVGTPDKVVDQGVKTQLDGDHTTGWGNAFFTDWNAGAAEDHDVDGGVCSTASPTIDASAFTFVDVGLWFFHNQTSSGDGTGCFKIEALKNGTVTNTLLSIGDLQVAPAWIPLSATLTNPGQLQLRAEACDGPGFDDLIEGGLDDVTVCGRLLPPRVRITHPSDGTPRGPGEPTSFTGTADDPDGGDLTGSISWSSSLDGALGTGGAVSVVLSPGLHTITASVIDANALSGEDSITVQVSPPTCTVDDDLEGGAAGWANDGASTCSTGAYVLGTPTLVVNGGVPIQPAGANSGVNAIFTAVNSSAGVDDVDGGNCILASPTWLVGAASTLSVAYFHGQRDAGDDPSGDFFLLEYSLNGGATWNTLVSRGDSTSIAAWSTATASIPGGSAVAIRVQCSDGALAGDLVECGIDDISVCQ